MSNGRSFGINPSNEGMKDNFMNFACKSLPVYLDSKAGNVEDQLISDLTSENVQGVKTRLSALFYLMSNDLQGVKTRLLTDVCVGVCGCVCVWGVGASGLPSLNSFIIFI